MFCVFYIIINVSYLLLYTLNGVWCSHHTVYFGSTEKKTTRYQCPADFVSFCHKPCSSTFTARLKKNKTELWLIKAPASFNPEWWVCYSDIYVSSLTAAFCLEMFGFSLFCIVMLKWTVQFNSN